MRRRLHRIVVPVLLLIVALPAVQPLLKGALPWSADGLLHFHRLGQLDRLLQHGLLHPRWAPDMGFGFGFPLFNYYAPLSYYLAESLYLIGLSTQAALLGAFILTIAVASVGAYLLVRDLFGPRAGFVAAFSYIYAPYFLFNLIHRGALAEALGLAWLPFTFWALRRLAIHGNRLDFALSSLFYTAILLTHNILALVSTPLLLLYGVVLWGLRDRDRSLAIRLGGALALGLGLAAFFWAPAFFERHYVQIHQLYAPADLNYRNNFITLWELLASPQPVDPALINASIPHSVGWPQLALALMALVGIRRFHDREERWHVALLGLGMLVLTPMMFPLSVGIWEAIPLLRFVQFPWRLLGPISLFLAVLAGAGVERLLARHKAAPTVISALTVIFATTVLFALTWLFPRYYPEQPEPNPIRLIAFEGETGALGTTSAGDYLPIWVDNVPPADSLLPAYRDAGPDFIIPRLARSSVPSGARVLEADYGLTTANLELDSPVSFTATFNWYFFPGWRVWLDGRPQRVYPVGDRGLVGVDVPAGRHHLRIALGPTPLRRWASVVSLVSIVILSMSVSIWPVDAASDSRRHSVRWSKTWIPCVVVAVVLFGLKTVYLDRYETIFRRTRFDGGAVKGVDHPLQVNFGDKLVLLGYDLNSSVVAADEAVELDLYWKASQPMTADYSIAVHLVDDQGRRYGQDDSQHPGGYPTSRWRLGTYARDRHRLVPWPGTPPGDYTLVIGVYDVASGGHLEAKNVSTPPLGTGYSLAPVWLTRPTRLPDLDDVQVTRESEADLTGSIRLLGFDPPPSEVEVGGRLPLTIYWQATAIPGADYEARLSLVAADGTRVAGQRSVPGRAGHPTSAWRQGEVVRDARSLLVPAAVPSEDYVLSLELLDEQGEPIGESAALMDVTVRAPERSFGVPAMRHPISTAVGNQAVLLGYELSTPDVAPGESLTVTLWWRAEAATRTSYVVFVHLIGQDEEIYAQSDQVPANGARPTTGWVPAEVIRDSHRLTLPPDAPRGRYQLRVGLYDPEDGERLPVNDTQGVGATDQIPLSTSIEVE